MLTRRTVRVGVTGLARAGKTAFLTSVAANLLALGAGRPVLVRCARVPADTLVPFGFRAADAVAVDVADHGPGIAAADQERIFEEFVQLPGAAPGARRIHAALIAFMALSTAVGVLLAWDTPWL